MKFTVRCLASVLVMLTFVVSPWAQEIDVEAQRAALRKADETWSKIAGTKDVDAFLTMVDENGSMLSPNAPILAGKEAVGQSATAVMSNPGFSLSWKSSTVEVSKAGDLGYTIGTYELKLQDPQGNPITDRGKYMTVWKKQRDGTWKVVADMFNTDLPAPE